MKSILSTTACICFVFVSALVSAQTNNKNNVPAGGTNANNSLSNLVAPTAVNQNLLPDTTVKRNIGSSSLYWKNAFITSFQFPDGSKQTTAFTPYTAGSGISISGTTISATGGSSQWITNGSNIYYNNGNVGIGTTTPTLGGLVVNTKVGAINAMFGSNTTGVAIETNYPGIAFNTYYNGGRKFIANGYGALIGLDPSIGLLGFYNSATAGTAGATANVIPDMAITAAGNVGIGTSTPGAKLDVKGDAHINGLTVGTGSGNAPSNSAVGYEALYSNTTGNSNTANGFVALYSNTTGNSNTANGYLSLYHNTTGSNNHSYGNNSLYNNTTGNNNIAIGSYALFSNSTGSNQLAIGDSALYHSGLSNAYATEPNIAVGAQALLANTSGYSNTAIGYQALYSNTSGALNTALGQGALHNNTIAQFNTAIGETTLYFNTGYGNTALGFAALDFNTKASNNTGLGNLSLSNNTTGFSNTAAGSSSLVHNTTGFRNTAIGDSAAYNDTASSYNTELGTYAGYGIVNGSENTYVGYYTGPSISGLFNSTALGFLATPTASNQIRLGNGSVTSIGGQVSYTTFSDGRFKKNIKQNVPGLAFINQLKPITYTLDITGIKQFKGEDKKDNTAIAKANDAQNEKTIHTGFVAQDVEATAKKMNYDFDGVDPAKNAKDLYGLRYSEFVVPLVKAVQELSKQNDSLKTQNQQLSLRLDKIEAMLSQQNNTTNNSISNAQTVTLSGGISLSQNIPNPFQNSTTINYSLPQNFSSAKIIVTDKSGKVLKEINVSGNGKGSLHVDASTLSSGAYQYSLYVDGRLIDTKQMVLTK